jgi:hypothetical protein
MRMTRDFRRRSSAANWYHERTGPVTGGVASFKKLVDALTE